MDCDSRRWRTYCAWRGDGVIDAAEDRLAALVPIDAIREIRGFPKNLHFPETFLASFATGFPEKDSESNDVNI